MDYPPEVLAIKGTQFFNTQKQHNKKILSIIPELQHFY